MGFEKAKRPIKLPTSTGVYSIQGGIAGFQARDFLNSAGFASATSAGTVIAWDKVTVISTTSTSANPVVMNMAAATSGAVAILAALTISATSGGVGVRLQAATSAKTFDGTNDQLLFGNQYHTAYLVAISSARVLAITPTTAMLTASTS